MVWRPGAGTQSLRFGWFGTQVRAPKTLVLGGRGFQVTPHTKSALKKLQDEKAIGYSQTVRSLKGSQKWKALRVDKTKHTAANMFRISAVF